MLQGGRHCGQTGSAPQGSRHRCRTLPSFCPRRHHQALLLLFPQPPFEALGSTWLLHAKRKSSVVAKNMDAEARLHGFESLLYHSLGLYLGKVIYIAWGKVYKFPFTSFTMCIKWKQEECLSHNAASSDGYMN